MYFFLTGLCGVWGNTRGVEVGQSFFSEVIMYAHIRTTPPGWDVAVNIFAIAHLIDISR